MISLPQDVSVQDDTFSKDLIRQFNKRRSRLRFELGFLTEEPSPESSSRESSPEPSDVIENDPIKETPRQRSSARSLLRKSSAFLKSKIESFKRPPTRIMKTTVDLQLQNVESAPFIPPSTITYPPKPLVYSPVEPISDEPARLFHRLSMPLLRSNHHSQHPYKSSRRKSEPDNKFKKK